MNKKTGCVIVGGGPAGIMLGYLLARAGIEVVVLEKWPDFFRDFRGDTIHPSTMTTLHELGLLDMFLKLPHSEMTRMTMHFEGKPVTMADFAHLRSECPFIAFIPQWDFLTFLAKQAWAFPNFHLMMGTEATDLLRENGHVVGVRAQHGEEIFDIRASLVVGADGRHSTIREKGGFVSEKLGVPIDVLWFRISRPEPDDKQSLGYFANGRALIMLDRHEYWQCGLIIQKDSFNEIKNAGLAAFRATIATLAHVSEEVCSEIDSWEKVKLLSVSVDHVRTWAQEGVVLIGDAAHAMSPIGGVGINYALQDAVASANILIPAFRQKNLSTEVLTRIQKRREKTTRRMQKLQVFLQNHIISPLLNSKRSTPPPLVFRFVARFPFLNRIPARIIGIGFQPEHIDAHIFNT